MKYASVFSKNKLVAFNRLSILAGLVILMTGAMLIKYMVQKESITEGMPGLGSMMSKTIILGSKHIDATDKRRRAPPPSYNSLCKDRSSNSENYKKWIQSRVDGSVLPVPKPHCPPGCKFKSNRAPGRGWECDLHNLDDGLVRRNCITQSDCMWCGYCGEDDAVLESEYSTPRTIMLL
jgi:hypothetical protein